MKTHKVIHQKDNCIGCNACVSIAPQNWEMDEETGKANLIGSKKKGDVYVGEIFDKDLEANKQAEKACPMRIIKIEE